MTRAPSTVPSTDGAVDLAVHDLGGDGPPLLLAHATGFHGRAWLPVARHLLGSFHCWAFDERGHGDTGAPRGAPPVPEDPSLGAPLYDWRRFADDALAVVDALGLDRPFAVGHSCGGALLLLAEAARPGTFRSLYCYEPIAFPVEVPPGPSAENPLRLGALRRREVFPSRDAAFDNYASKPPFSTLDREALRAYVDFGFDDLDDGTVRLKCRGTSEANVYLMGSAHDAFARSPAVACPVTIACGEHTDVFGPDVIARQASRMPHARTEVLPGLGHFGPLQDPAAVAASIHRSILAG